MKRIALVFILISALVACSDQKEKLFTFVSPEESGITFNNSVIENDTFSVLEFDYMYNGGGVSVGDLNNDNLPDIYFTGNNVSSKLYLNKGGLKFEDVTEKAGVGTSQWAEGVAMVDINSDGLLDIYVSTSGRNPDKPNHNLLFLNQGVKEGVPVFKESAKTFGIADSAYNTQGAFFDYDKDGDLDLYVLSNTIEGFNRNTPRPRKMNGDGRSNDKLYRNDGGKYTNVTKEAGILIEGYGLGVTISDLNKDGWLDIYCANDFISNDLMYINNGDGTFTNKIAEAIRHQSYNGMGVDASDFNNDGWADIVVLDMLPDNNPRIKSMFPGINYDRFNLNLQLGYEPQYVRNTLQLNNGDGTFSEIGQLSGIHGTDWSWSSLFADYDNDGLKDLLITNGYGKDVTDLDYIVYSNQLTQFGTEEAKRKQMKEEMKKLKDVDIPNYIFKNKGDLTFKDESKDWGIEHSAISNGAAYADLDNDGDLDLIINNLNKPAFLYRNNAEKYLDHKFLRVKLKGPSGNTFGLGAKVEVKHSGKYQYFEQVMVKGYKSTVEPIIHVGLGKDSLVTSLEVTWLDGKYQKISNLKANQVVEVDYKNATLKPDRLEKEAHETQTLFSEASKASGIIYKHEEQDFVDFKSQPLLPHKNSSQGPSLAVGDVNNDGFDDMYVGGSAGKKGSLFVQNEKGKFEEKALEEKRKLSEDIGALFFDCDNDQDLDLYVVSGSTEFSETTQEYQDRLYKNDGKGNFQKDSTALPLESASGSCVVAGDYDKDGDLDLFVGGRVIPRRYPLPAESFLLRNDGGKFSKVSKETAEGLEKTGLVTSAIWTDFNNDTWIDLIVVGEWMPLTFYENKSGRLKNVTLATGLKNTEGWWNSITGGDFDNDGDIDYIAGNLGLNSRYKASEKEPLCVYAKDYDNNGTLDAVFCHYLQGKLTPVHPRDVLVEQMPPVKRRVLTYSEYGAKSFSDLFTEEEVEDAYIAQAKYMQTAYIENKGNSKFEIKALPVRAQFSPAFGMITDDFNGDQNLDLLSVGNYYSSESLSGRYDASYGDLFVGDGKGGFSFVKNQKSGFKVSGDAKALVEVYNNFTKKQLIVASVNQDSIKVFERSQTEKISKLDHMDASCIIELDKGKKRKVEFYYGSSYLSQSSRVVKLPESAIKIKVYNYKGTSRELNVQSSPISLKK